MLHIIQVYFIDEYGCKRIVDRVRTTKTIQEYLNTTGKDRGLYRWSLSEKKFYIDSKYQIEELPIAS